MRTFLPLAALALVAAPIPAAACSPAMGYHVPTNMELVEQADLILIGKVTSGDFEPDSTPEQMIEILPEAAIKGSLPAAPLALAGMIAPDADAILSNPYELHDPHPQALDGACNRYMFPGGSRVLFFLTWEGDHWRPAGGPFSRWAEDVLTDEAPWLVVTRLYAEIAALPASERAAALTTRRSDYGAEYDNPVAQLIARDIDRQLAGPNKPLREELPPAPPEGD